MVRSWPASAEGCPRRAGRFPSLRRKRQRVRLRQGMISGKTALVGVCTLVKAVGESRLGRTIGKKAELIAVSYDVPARVLPFWRQRLVQGARERLLRDGVVPRCADLREISEKSVRNGVRSALRWIALGRSDQTNAPCRSAGWPELRVTDSAFRHAVGHHKQSLRDILESSSPAPAPAPAAALGGIVRVLTHARWSRIMTLPAGTPLTVESFIPALIIIFSAKPITFQQKIYQEVCPYESYCGEDCVCSYSEARRRAMGWARGSSACPGCDGSLRCGWCDRLRCQA